MRTRSRPAAHPARSEEERSGLTVDPSVVRAMFVGVLAALAIGAAVALYAVSAAVGAGGHWIRILTGS